MDEVILLTKQIKAGELQVRLAERRWMGRDGEVVAVATVAGNEVAVGVPTRVKGGVGIYKHAPAGPWIAIVGDKTVLLTVEEGTPVLESVEAARTASASRAKDSLDRAIPGLDLLRSAIREHDVYASRFDAMMEDEYNDGARPPARPTSDLAALSREYPRAAAYLRAEQASWAADYRKSGAGERAKKILEAGGEIAEADAVLAGWLSPAEIEEAGWR